MIVSTDGIKKASNSLGGTVNILKPEQVIVYSTHHSVSYEDDEISDTESYSNCLELITILHTLIH